MTGFLDRLLHADKSRPSDIDAAAAMLILSSIRQAKQDRYRSRSFPMRHHYALRAQKT